MYEGVALISEMAGAGTGLAGMIATGRIWHVM